MSLARISIVTPVLNQRAFIGACLSSIHEQAYPELEHIVLDAGSTDGSFEIVQDYVETLAVARQREDSGQYHAINEGMSMTTGEIVGWLNADDVLLPGSLSVVAELFDRFPSVDWITGARSSCDERGRIVQVSPVQTVYSQSSLRRGEYDGTCLPTVQQEGTFWRRSLWERVGGLDLQWSLAADLDLWTRMARYADLVSVSALLACPRIHAGQRTHKHLQESWAERDAIRELRGGREILRTRMFERLSTATRLSRLRICTPPSALVKTRLHPP